MIGRIKTFADIAVRSFKLLQRSEPLILSSSTAFFTTFALSPILLLLVSLLGLYFKSDQISHQLFDKLASAIGYEAAMEIESIVNNFMRVETNLWITAAGLIFFVFVATTLLIVVKENIHKVWRIRKVSSKVRYIFKERGIIALLLLLTGALFLLSLLIDSLLAISFDYLQITLPRVGIIFIRLLNIIFSLIVVTIWFTLIFKILPQARVEWDVAFNGAFMTAILFNAGKFALGKFLVHAKIVTIFGASASFAVLLLFIFYSSFILYYGAAFTHEYAEYSDKHICAGKYASEYEEKLIGSD
jgi:membrane protein